MEEPQGCRDLYFIGECVDVTGWLGGYNFQWGWQRPPPLQRSRV